MSSSPWKDIARPLPWRASRVPQTRPSVHKGERGLFLCSLLGVKKALTLSPLCLLLSGQIFIYASLAPSHYLSTLEGRTNLLFHFVGIF